MAKGTCSVEGCESPTRCRGWCTMHYERWRIHGDVMWEPKRGGSCSEAGCDRPVMGWGFCRMHYKRWRREQIRLGLRSYRACSVPGCDRPHEAQGLCGAHYVRLRLEGDPLAETPIRRRARLGEPLAWLRAVVADPPEPEACLFGWPFNHPPEHYPTVSWRGRSTPVHVVIMGLLDRPKPTAKSIVRHLCGNGIQGCLNPAHVVWGTHAENEADKLLHGTRARGETNGTAKLTEDAVRAIRASADTYRVLAARYGVGRDQIGRVVRRESWSHVL